MRICILLLLVQSCLSSYSQQTWQAENSYKQVFSKNQGQFPQYGDQEILYAAHIGTTDFFFGKFGYVVVRDVYLDKEEEHERWEKAEHGGDITPREKEYWVVEFVNPNSAAEIVAEDQQQYTFNYGNGGDPVTHVCPVFKTLLYKDIYPGIDLKLRIEGENGFKYDIVVHPGADLSSFKMQYPESAVVSVDENNKLKMEGLGFLFSESIPSAYEKETGRTVEVMYRVEKNIVSFETDVHSDKTLVIDPWPVLVSPFTSVNDFYKVDFDASGNVLALGEHGQEIAKYNSTGVLQWVYIATAVSYQFHGDFVTRYSTGDIFYMPVLSDMIKISPAGTELMSIGITGLAGEVMRIEWDEINDLVILGKGAGVGMGAVMGTISEDFSTQTETEVLPLTDGFYEDVAMTELDPDGTKIYFIPCGAYGDPAALWDGYHNDLITATLPGFTSPSFFNTWHPFMELYNGDYGDYDFPLDYKPVTFNGIAVNSLNLYTYDGNMVKKWDKVTGTIEDSLILTQPTFASSGIAVDPCGYVYIGTIDSVVILDPSLDHDGGYAMTGPVIDVRINGTNLYACGEGFLTELALAGSVLIPSLSATDESCNDCTGTATSDTTVCAGYIFESILWSPSGQTTLTAIDLCSGWHVATSTFINGTDTITFIDSVEVFNGGSAITVDVNFTDETCPGADDGTITLSATSGTSPFDYDIVVASNTTGIFTDLPAGTYDVTVTDANGCSFTTTVTIDAGTGLTVDIEFTDEACGGAEDGTITLTPTSGSSPYNFDIGVASNTTGDFSGLDDGTYTITVTDDNGCVFTGSVTITESPGINLAVVTQNDPSCFGFTDGSVTVETLGGTSPYDYTWSPTNPIPGATYNNLGDGTVTVYCTDANGCTDSLVIVINEPEAIDADLTLFMPVCNGDQNGYAVVDTVYNAQGDLTNITYIWNPDPAGVTGVGADSSYNLPAGTYTLTINDDNGCSNEITFEITQPDELIFTEIGYDPAYCRLFPYQSGNGVVYAAAGGGTPDYTYEWVNLTTLETNNATTWGGLNPACYEMTVTDDAGCILQQIICVDSLNPIADFDVTSAELNGLLEGTAVVCATFTNQSLYFSNPNDPLADTTFFWNLNTPTAPWQITHSYYEEFDTCYELGGEYEVCLVAQNKNGCVDTACKTITVFTPLVIEPVNIITPDGDGINDVFTFVHVAKGIKEFHCVIVNRWGSVMAEITDIATGWNAKDKSGSNCTDGVYFYTYEGLAENGEPFSGQGTLQIVGSQP